MSRQPFHLYKRSQGNVMPAVIIMSLAVIILSLSLLQVSSSLRRDLNDQYYLRLATEAAESGITYANHCIASTFDSSSQSWPVGSTLTQSTGCNATTLSPAPVLYQNAKLRTSFSIGDLVYRNDEALSIKSVGTTDLLNADGSVRRSYSVTRMEVSRTALYKAATTSSGLTRICAIINNAAWCWGQNHFGQLGNGDTTDFTTPQRVATDAGILQGKKIIDISAGSYHTCAIAVDSANNNHVYCWGANSYGQLGNNLARDTAACPGEGGNTQCVRKPVEITNSGTLSGRRIVKVVATNISTYALDDTGKVHAWGYNSRGQLGDNSTTQRNRPVRVGTTVSAFNNSTFIDIASGPRSATACALTADPSPNNMWCWGSNLTNAIGNGVPYTTAAQYTRPQRVSAGDIPSGSLISNIELDGWTSLDTSPQYTGSRYFEGHACVISKTGGTAPGNIYCWGSNNRGQLGDNTVSASSTTPRKVYRNDLDAASDSFTDVAVTGITSCGLTTLKKAYCWGANEGGTLAQPKAAFLPATTCTPVSGPPTPTTLGSCFITRKPMEIDPDPATNPVAGRPYDLVTAGSSRSCVLVKYTYYCWGGNSWGQIGDGTTINAYSPTKARLIAPTIPSYIF